MYNRIVRLSFILTILLIGFFSLSSAFADEPNALSFNIVHLIDISADYKFIFQDSSNEAQSTINLTEGEINENFISLYMQHATNVIIRGLTISASDLETSDKTAAYPYTMSLTDAQGNAIEWVANPEGKGSGYAHLVSQTTVYRYKDTGGQVKFADFSIDLSALEDVPMGSYEGTMTLYSVVI